MIDLFIIIFEPLQFNYSDYLPRPLAGELGFEPRLAESESAVLPLDDSPINPKLNAWNIEDAYEPYVNQSFYAQLYVNHELGDPLFLKAPALFHRTLQWL